MLEGAAGTVRCPGLHTPNEPIRSCRGELMQRDVAKFIEEPGTDGEGGIIDWPIARFHVSGPTGNVREGF